MTKSLSKTGIPYLDAVPVPGFDGYRVTEEGMIFGLLRVQMKPMVTDSGHLYVMAAAGDENRVSRGRSCGRRQRKLYVHQAVLLAFVGEPAEGQECRHLDGDPKNNRVGNLKWGTRAENMQDRVRHGEQWLTKLTANERSSIRGLYNVVGGFSSRRLADMFGVTHTTILRVAKGGR